MKTALTLILLVPCFVGAYKLYRRMMEIHGNDPDAIAELMQRHPWLQWYLVILGFAILGLICATTSGMIDPTPLQEFGMLIGGLVLLFGPIFIVGRRE